MAVALVFASLVPPLRIRSSNVAKPVSIPPPLPPDRATATEAEDITVPEGEPEEIDESAKVKARDLVSKSAVDSAACDILGMAQNWPKVLEANNGKLSLPFRAMTEGRMPAEHVGARDGRWANWLSNGIAYRLELWVTPTNGRVFEDDLQIGDLQLWVGGEAVMHLRVQKRTATQHDHWAPFDVLSLRAGSWMLRLNELAAYLRAANEPHAEGAKNAPQEVSFRRGTPTSVVPGTEDE